MKRLDNGWGCATAVQMSFLRTVLKFAWNGPEPSGLFQIKWPHESGPLTQRVNTWIAAGATCGLSVMNHDPGGVVRGRPMVCQLKIVGPDRGTGILPVQLFIVPSRAFQGYSTLVNPTEPRTKQTDRTEFSEFNSVNPVNSV